MRVYIKLLCGKTISVYADTVDKALLEIQTMEGVSAEKLCLLHNGKIINELIEDSLLHLAIRVV